MSGINGSGHSVSGRGSRRSVSFFTTRSTHRKALRRRKADQAPFGQSAAVCDYAKLCSLPAASVTPSRRTPKHVGDEFLRLANLFAESRSRDSSSQRHQLLVHVMMPMPGPRSGICVIKACVVASRIAWFRTDDSNSCLSPSACQPVRDAGALHDGAACRGFTAMDSETPIAPSFPTTHRFPPTCHFRARIEGTTMQVDGKKLNVAQEIARLVQNPAERQRYGPQIRNNPLALPRGVTNPEYGCAVGKAIPAITSPLNGNSNVQF